jgi:hypothetical protein
VDGAGIDFLPRCASRGRDDTLASLISEFNTQTIAADVYRKTKVEETL